MLWDLCGSTPSTFCGACFIRGQQNSNGHKTYDCRHRGTDDAGNNQEGVFKWVKSLSDTSPPRGIPSAPKNSGLCYYCWLPDRADNEFHDPEASVFDKCKYRLIFLAWGRELHGSSRLRKKFAAFMQNPELETVEGLFKFLYQKMPANPYHNTVYLLLWIAQNGHL